jgi:outer membrane protein TolC
MGCANGFRHRALFGGLCLILSGNAVSLSLGHAISLAEANDPWLQGSYFREDAFNAEAISASALPDPTISIGTANLPTDTFDFRQEGMTQTSIAISQRFPRGKSRELIAEQKRLLSQQQPMLRADRQAKVAATVSKLWLEGFRAQQTIALIAQHRPLFEQLRALSHSNYGAGLKHASQQDIIGAELALSRLDDRVIALKQRQELARDQLGEWLPAKKINEFSATPEQTSNVSTHTINDSRAANALQSHPAIQAIEQNIAVAHRDVALRQQEYKAEWAFNAKYAHRAEDPLGNDRADLFSVGVSVDIPLFTAKRQDQNLNAAQARADAIRTDKAILLRRMMANLKTQLSQLQRTEQRLTLYKSRLLPDANEQVKASLNAYQNDRGDFAEVIQARIYALDAKIDELNISVDRQQILATINYLLAGERYE